MYPSTDVDHNQEGCSANAEASDMERIIQEVQVIYPVEQRLRRAGCNEQAPGQVPQSQK